MRRVLDNLRLWTATVLINSMIMSVYLWHITIMVIVVSLLYLVDGFGLRLEPGTGEWFLSRPLRLRPFCSRLVSAFQSRRLTRSSEDSPGPVSPSPPHSFPGQRSEEAISRRS